MNHLPWLCAEPYPVESDEHLAINAPMLEAWLVEFLRDEIVRRRGFTQAVVGVSGGVDSALVAFLLARALGPENVYGIRMPYRTSSLDSLDHAALVQDATGINLQTIEITEMVDGYLKHAPDTDGRRRGNIMARSRMIVLFDQSQKLGTIPVGTGNKTERLFGYYTWHADDSPPINPLGDLFKSQVWALSRHLGVPSVIVDKPASADLIVGQTDETDFGISYVKADRILYFLLHGYSGSRLEAMGFPAAEVAIVKKRLDSTHWKRHLPTTAMLSNTAINEYYLRPVDY